MSSKRKTSNELFMTSIQKYFKPSILTDSLEHENHSNTNPDSNQSCLISDSCSTIQNDPAIGSNIYEFNKKPIQPIINFPKNKYNRKFVASWYKDYMWLEYSVSTDKAFCYICRIFSGNKEFKFSRVGICDWKHACERFKDHEISDVHKAATKSYSSRIEKDKNNTSINVELESCRQKQVKKNREYLRKVVETILWLCQQGLALRGHNEDNLSENRGNFLELLELRGKDLPILQEESIKYAYTSPAAQNEIIELIGSNITTEISEQSQNTPFSLIVDETADISTHEQVAIIIRYTDDYLKIKERFVGFYKTGSTCGKDLDKIVNCVLVKLGLSADSYLVAQGYDGASNMSGHRQGLSAWIKSKVKRAIYVHCLCHRLNLSLQSACSETTEVRNCLGTVNSLYNFVNGSAKRKDIFQNSQLQKHGITLKRHAETRWGSRKNSVDSCVDTYEFILDTLDYIQLTDKTCSSEAVSLLKSIKEFEFLFVLHVLHEVFDRTGILSDALQDSELDVERSIRLKSTTIESLLNIKTQTSFDLLYEKCIQKAKDNDLDEPSLPRQRKATSRYKTFLPEVPQFRSVKEKYQHIYFKILEITVKEINERFQDETLDLVLLIARIIKGYSKNEDFERLKNLDYYNNLINFESLRKELISWKFCLDKFKDKTNLDSIVSIADLFVKEQLSKDYPQVKALMRIYLAIPSTSVAAERAFSVLKRIKTWLRNSMEQDRLSALSIINIEKEFSREINIDNIIDQFATHKDRRMQFF